MGKRKVLTGLRKLFEEDIWSIDEWNKPGLIIGKLPDKHVHIHLHKHTHQDGRHYEEIETRHFREVDGTYVED